MQQQKGRTSTIIITLECHNFPHCTRMSSTSNGIAIFGLQLLQTLFIKFFRKASYHKAMLSLAVLTPDHFLFFFVQIKWTAVSRSLQKDLV